MECIDKGGPGEQRPSLDLSSTHLLESGVKGLADTAGSTHTHTYKHTHPPEMKAPECPVIAGT